MKRSVSKTDTKPPRPRRCAGLSLAELVLALASTALLGTAVAAMLHAVAYGAQSGTDLRDLVPKHRVLSGRIADTIRGAEQVVELSATEVTLWTDDLDDDDDYDSNEIAWVTFDSGNSEIEFATASSSHTPYAVTAVDIATLDTTLSGSGELDTTVWGRDVTVFSFTGDTAAPTTALVTWRQAFTLNGLTDTQVHAVELGSYE